MRHVEIGAGGSTGRHNRVHATQQPTRIGGVAALGRRGEEDFQRHAQNVAQHHARQHFDIAARVPDARRPIKGQPPQAEKIAKAQTGQAVRQAGTEGRVILAQLALLRHDLDDGRRNTGKP